MMEEPKWNCGTVGGCRAPPVNVLGASPPSFVVPTARLRGVVVVVIVIIVVIVVIVIVIVIVIVTS